MSRIYHRKTIVEALLSDPILRAFLLGALLISSVPDRAMAEEPDEEFDRKLAAGFEPAALLADSTSADGRLSVIFTARKKNLKPAKWPSIIRDVHVSSTEANGSDEYTTENWIVSIPEKKRLAVVRSESEDFKAWHGGQNLRYFSALWGPEQEGWHYGLLNYSNRWGCTDIFLANSDGEQVKLTSIHALLDATARKFISSRIKAGDLGRYEIGYELLGVKEPGQVVGDPTTVRIGVIAQIPKSEDDALEATMTVNLARNNKGVASAIVLAVNAGLEQADAKPVAASTPTPAPAPARPAATTPSAKDFLAFRNEWSEKAKTNVWKSVRKDFKTEEKGRTEYVIGWVEGKSLQRLMHVDRTDDKNKAITLYFWRDGQLTSVFKLLVGDYVEISDVGEATRTYNYVNEKLVGWLSSDVSDTQGDGSDPAMQKEGEGVLIESRKRAQVIYQAIGAD